MQWLLHGSVSDDAAESLTTREDIVHLPAECELTESSSVQDVLNAAQKKQWDILTTDASLARAVSDGVAKFNRSIVHIPAGDQVASLERVFKRYPRLTPGRLYTVTASRVKIRQLPTRRRPSTSIENS